MKNYPVAYLEHLRGPVTHLAICWQIEKSNGTYIRGTDHDRDIEILPSSPSNHLEGVYQAAAGITGSAIRSSSDMSVDNMEVNGAIDLQVFGDITVAEIESGLLDGAPISTFRVIWDQPNVHQEIMRRGYLGEIARASDGRYTTEVRGITQVLQQIIGRTAGDRCDVAEFGDSRCKYDIAAATGVGTVTAVTSRRRWDSTVSNPAGLAIGAFRLGKVTWLTGENTGFVGQIKRDAVNGVLGELEMWESFYYDPQVGDTFSFAPGCDRRYVTCKDVYNNLINFRGPAIFCPGMDAIIRAP